MPFCTEKFTVYYRGQKLYFDHKSLEFYDIKAASTVFVYDNGHLVPLRASKIFVYSGPIIMFYLFDKYRLSIYERYEGKEFATRAENYDLFNCNEPTWVQDLA